MTDEEKNFNKWFDEYNLEKICVFEEVDLKMAYLQGCADEVKKWEKVNGELEKENAELKDKNKALEQYADLADAKVDEVKSKLTEAKEIIRNLIRVTYGEGWNYSLDWKNKAEKFLEEK